MGSFRTAGLDEEQQKGGWRDGSGAKSVDLSSALGTHTEGPPHLLYLQLQEIRYPCLCRHLYCLHLHIPPHRHKHLHIVKIVNTS